MIPTSTIIYDCEIVKCVPDRGRPNDPRFDYCAGWHDHANMGISVICAWDYLLDKMQVFTGDTLEEFAALVQSREHIIGFNSRYFDDLLCQANGVKVQTSYDILVEVRRATGQPDGYVRGLTRAGYGLDNLVWANFGENKSGDGATAPKLWQQGKHQEVIDYCMRDVMLTKRLLESYGSLKDPCDGSTFAMACPPMWKETDTRGDVTASMVKETLLNQATPEQARIINGRDAFTRSYCARQGWDQNNLSMEQIIEIRAQEGWKTP